MLMYLVLGCLMDAMAMIILTIPIIFPVIVALGFDPIWFGVIIVMTVELGLIHPPVGMNVFVIKSVVHDVSFSTIFKGVLPFIATDIIRLIILIAFPILALCCRRRCDASEVVWRNVCRPGIYCRVPRVSVLRSLLMTGYRGQAPV